MSMLNFGYIMGILALVVLTPVFMSCCYLFILTLFSLLPNWRKLPEKETAKFAILLPVKNEESKIEAAVRNLITGLEYNPDLFEVVVIADNCTDSTAFAASFAGAKVLESANDWKQGRGYALEWAFAQLIKNNHDAYLIIDVDSKVDPQALRFLDAALSEGAMAMQLSGTMLEPEASWSNRFLDVVLARINYLRPKGRKNLGLSCGITGNGFCLSKTLLEKLPYEAFELVEGLEYHYKLVLNGEKVKFIPGAKVSSRYDLHDKETIKQYESNRYQISKKYLFPLIKAALGLNCSAFDNICELYTMSLKTIISALIAVTLVGGLLFFSAASLPECEDLFWLSVWVLLPAFFGIFMIWCYIFAGMLERRMPLNTWFAVGCYPFYLIAAGFKKVKHYLIHD